MVDLELRSSSEPTIVALKTHRMPSSPHWLMRNRTISTPSPVTGPDQRLSLFNQAPCKKALTVLDQFHVQNYLNDALDKVRKAKMDKEIDLADLLHCRKKFILTQRPASRQQRNTLKQLDKINNTFYRTTHAKLPRLASGNELAQHSHQDSGRCRIRREVLP